MASALALVREIYVTSHDSGIRKAVRTPSLRAAVSRQKRRISVVGAAACPRTRGSPSCLKQQRVPPPGWHSHGSYFRRRRVAQVAGASAIPSQNLQSPLLGRMRFMQPIAGREASSGGESLPEQASLTFWYQFSSRPCNACSVPPWIVRDQPSSGYHPRPTCLRRIQAQWPMLTPRSERHSWFAVPQGPSLSLSSPATTNRR